MDFGNMDAIQSAKIQEMIEHQNLAQAYLDQIPYEARSQFLVAFYLNNFHLTLPKSTREFGVQMDGVHGHTSREIMDPKCAANYLLKQEVKAHVIELEKDGEQASGSGMNKHHQRMRATQLVSRMSFQIIRFFMWIYALFYKQR